MKTAFEIVLMIFMFLSFCGVIAEENKEAKLNFTALCIASIFALVLVVWVL